MMRQFLLPILLLLSASAAAGGDPAIITPLTECPAVRPACMVFNIYLTTPEVNGEGHAAYTKVISMDPDKNDLTYRRGCPWQAERRTGNDPPNRLSQWSVRNVLPGLVGRHGRCRQ